MRNCLPASQHHICIKGICSNFPIAINGILFSRIRSSYAPNISATISPQRWGKVRNTLLLFSPLMHFTPGYLIKMDRGRREGLGIANRGNFAYFCIPYCKTILWIQYSSPLFDFKPPNLDIALLLVGVSPQTLHPQNLTAPKLAILGYRTSVCWTWKKRVSTKPNCGVWWTCKACLVISTLDLRK